MKNESREIDDILKEYYENFIHSAEELIEDYDERKESLMNLIKRQNTNQVICLICFDLLLAVFVLVNFIG